MMKIIMDKEKYHLLKSNITKEKEYSTREQKSLNI